MRDLRDLNSYLRRRKIVNKEEWLKLNKMTSITDLQSFCTANLLFMNDDDWKFLFSDPVDKAASKLSPTKPKPTAKVQPKEDKKTWHTPAAKRPINKSSTKRSSSVKKKPSKS